MFSHVHVGARDLECLVVFYDALLAKLGLIQMPEGNGGAARGVGWRYPNRRWPQFYVQHPINGLAATWGNGVQVSFLAASEAQVREVWALAIEMGGTNEGSRAFENMLQISMQHIVGIQRGISFVCICSGSLSVA